MKFTVDESYLLDTFQTIVNTPSPVGYSLRMNPVLEKIAAALGLEVTYDNRSAAYIRLEGEDASKTVLVTSHCDTLGLMVRDIAPDGTLLFRSLGGGSHHSIEGESVTVYTRDGKAYTGLVAHQKHSVHSFDNAHSAPRDDDNMMVVLDECVKTRADVLALGIGHGDMIAVDPRCQITESGFVKSRYLDDKGGVACVFAALKYLKDNGLKPKYNTVLQFTYMEEIGVGGTYVPEGVSELVGIDMGVIGPHCDGNEYSVSICAKDASYVYDYVMTNRLIDYAKKAECDYAVDLYVHYGSDAAAAARAGNNVRTGLFGMGVFASHGMERTHLKGLVNTVGLLLAYVLDI